MPLPVRAVLWPAASGASVQPCPGADQGGEVAGGWH